jgi:hypothetical protein
VTGSPLERVRQSLRAILLDPERTERGPLTITRGQLELLEEALVAADAYAEILRRDLRQRTEVAFEFKDRAEAAEAELARWRQTASRLATEAESEAARAKRMAVHANEQEARAAQLERQLNDMPSPEAFEYLTEYLTELRERHVEQIKALEQKNRKAEARLEEAERRESELQKALQDELDNWNPEARPTITAEKEAAEARLESAMTGWEEDEARVAELERELEALELSGHKAAIRIGILEARAAQLERDLALEKRDYEECATERDKALERAAAAEELAEQRAMFSHEQAARMGELTKQAAAAEQALGTCEYALMTGSEENRLEALRVAGEVLGAQRQEDFPKPRQVMDATPPDAYERERQDQAT